MKDALYSSPPGQKIRAIIARLKNKSFGSVSIRGIIRRTNYDLILLTRDSITDDHIVALLSRWRKKHETWFPTQFPVTRKRTKGWLKNNVINTQDRLLFMIRVHDTYIGHVGLYRFDFEKKTCEIDNIVRGRKGYPGLVTAAIRQMMQWGMSTFGLNGYTLQTTSDNERALRLYNKLGFVETKRIRLIHRTTRDGGEWITAPMGYKRSIQRYDVFMKWKGIYEKA
ncbi:MAG TPA: GNAT family N-acetyltransferase [Patescibacteria group bacterium]|jgi:RimJ/RimL family protein N-acetyltransferase|nr:GNAT family N-acetyltransferase [Patescibacteria group bacterium]